MIRSDLANKLAAKMNISKQEADRTLLAFINGIMTNLEKDGRVVIQGFGSFRLKEGLGTEPRVYYLTMHEEHAKEEEKEEVVS